MDALKEITEEYFDRDYIYAEQSPKRELILQKIEDFLAQNPDFPSTFIACFHQQYPNWKTSDWSQFYASDLHRCFRILVEREQSDERYVFLISIFGFFAVYRMSLTKIGDRYVYGDLIFINNGENEFCDNVYETCMPQKFPWLDSQTLNTVIEELSARNPYHSILITYAKLLFTFHYNI
ncbi:hypothetical protein [Parapedobacter koreensis]|uniref:Uncharacterized protein n=1 Tax=Parapedobacter koreensis TaxID=332977 RepID=A0A1H7GY75_9SPHI|nr:hypothetical protein [Parapedobacter koreensis]SEK42012.1 hypothetical protein SAMN05421740_101815 [Parapedobacter koreensis]